MTDVVAKPEAVSMTVDGKQVAAQPGEMIIAAAERNGVYIPRFCYHPRMRPVGMCRMCLVEVSTPRGLMLQPACFVPVAEGQEVITNSDAVKNAQNAVLEFLLVNHPLDCPVCDKGGECPLQDQTLAYGPGETRFVEEKRHWEKPISLSELVYLDRERCIQCDRCTRFADEVAGDPLIEFIGRGSTIEVNTFPDQPFASYFSGNTVQICPVGALLARPYRFKARPWDLEQVESTCQTCSVGCRMAVQSSQDEITRYLGLDSDPVNHGWLCDKGRFAYEAVNSDQRLRAPQLRTDRSSDFSEASWAEALDAAGSGLADARSSFGAEAIAVIGGARLANEDAYAWAKLAKSVLGTDNVDAQLGDGLPAEVVLGLPRATIDDACSASTVILLAPDLKEELPILYLRLRGAVMESGLALIELSPGPTGLTPYARARVGYRPGEAAAAARELLEQHAPLIDGDVVVVLGRPSLAESAASIAEAAAVFAALPNVRFLSALRRGNVHGALDLGLAPGVLPGRVGLDEGRDYWSDAWGRVPTAAGLDTQGILEAAVQGRIHGLVLLGADPISDFPDADLASRALDAVGFVVAIDCFRTESVERADVVLPAATFTERPGSTTNVEGRVTRLGQKITPPGVAWPDWMIAVELAARLEGDLGFTSVDQIWSEIEHKSPVHAGITSAVLGSREYRDGVVAPLSDGHLPDPVADDRQLDPTATAGVQEVETQGVTADPPQHAQAVDDDRTDEDAESGDDDEAAVAKPPMLRFTGVDEPARSAPVDAYSLRLVATRRLYDRGVAVRFSPSLAPLQASPALAVNPTDLDRLGIKSGGQVRMRSARLTTVIDAIADPLVPQGSAVLPFNLGDVDASLLIDAAAPVNDVAIETP